MVGKIKQGKGDRIKAKSVRHEAKIEEGRLKKCR
jgi:hypothetical protein